MSRGMDRLLNLGQEGCKSFALAAQQKFNSLRPIVLKCLTRFVKRLFTLGLYTACDESRGRQDGR